MAARDVDLMESVMTGLSQGFQAFVRYGRLMNMRESQGTEAVSLAVEVYRSNVALS
jgi:hypothetical protein